jgi:hypothetical protein
MGLIKYNDNSISEITATGLASGSMVLIKEQTASASASISFVDGTDGVVLDSTYNTYLFKFINIHPATDSVGFSFNLSSDGGSSYNVTKTTTLFVTYHSEADDATTLQYDDSRDMAQGTGYAILGGNTGNDNDQASSGYLHLFNPSSTTYVKHFISNFSNSHSGDYTYTNYVAGYGNTTSAINAIDFKFSSGNIDAGTIKLYGVRES